MDGDKCVKDDDNKKCTNQSASKDAISKTASCTEYAPSIEEGSFHRSIRSVLEKVLSPNTGYGELACKSFHPFTQINHVTMLLAAIRLDVLQKVLHLCTWTGLLCLSSNLNTLMDEVCHFDKISLTKPTCCKSRWSNTNSTWGYGTLISCNARTNMFYVMPCQADEWFSTSDYLMTSSTTFMTSDTSKVDYRYIWPHGMQRNKVYRC